MEPVEPTTLKEILERLGKKIAPDKVLFDLALDGCTCCAQCHGGNWNGCQE